MVRESALRGDRAGAVVEVDLDEEGRAGLAPQGERPVGRVPVPAMRQTLLRKVQVLRTNYRVTIQLVQNLLLTSKQKFRFGWG